MIWDVSIPRIGGGVLEASVDAPNRPDSFVVAARVLGLDEDYTIDSIRASGSSIRQNPKLPGRKKNGIFRNMLESTVPNNG